MSYLKQQPTQDGYFGDFGGAFLPPELVPHFEQINRAYMTLGRSADFLNELKYIRKHYQGRPTPVYYAHNLSKEVGAHIYLKREDLNHSGAHKLNHCMAEALLAKHMGKTKLIAETGAGQHGVALATAAAYFGMECEIHMGEIDIAKEAPNVTRMKLLGAQVVPVGFGGRSLKEAVDSAFQSYLGQTDKAIFAIGSVVGPHPFPLMVRNFQSIVAVLKLANNIWKWLANYRTKWRLVSAEVQMLWACLPVLSTMPRLDSTALSLLVKARNSANIPPP